MQHVVLMPQNKTLSYKIIFLLFFTFNFKYANTALLAQSTTNNLHKTSDALALKLRDI